MRNRYVAAVAAAALLVGGGSAYAYTTHEDTSAPVTRTASAPLDPVARDIDGSKGRASTATQVRHAKATAARKAAAARRDARGGYEPSTAVQDNGRVPTTSVGTPCDGDPASFHVTQPDGTCGGPIHRGGGGYYDNDGNPCPGTMPCEDNPAYPDDNTNNDPLIKKCPSGAATSPECDQLIKHGQPNMQKPKCGDGSTPAYLRQHGVHCND